MYASRGRSGPFPFAFGFEPPLSSWQAAYVKVISGRPILQRTGGRRFQNGLRVVEMVKGDEEVVEGTAAAIQPSEEGADNIWMENEGRGRAKQGGGLWKMEYIGYYIGIGQSFCRCYLFLFFLFFFFSFCLEFWVRGNGSRADRSVSLERRERRGNRGSCCRTEREGERRRRDDDDESVECRERQKQRRTKKEEEEEVVGGRLKKQLFNMRPYHGEFRRRRGNMLGGQQQ